MREHGGNGIPVGICRLVSGIAPFCFKINPAVSLIRARGFVDTKKYG